MKAMLTEIDARIERWRARCVGEVVRPWPSDMLDVLIELRSARAEAERLREQLARVRSIFGLSEQADLVNELEAHHGLWEQTLQEYIDLKNRVEEADREIRCCWCGEAVRERSKTATEEMQAHSAVCLKGPVVKLRGRVAELESREGRALALLRKCIEGDSWVSRTHGPTRCALCCGMSNRVYNRTLHDIDTHDKDCFIRQILELLSGKPEPAPEPEGRALALLRRVVEAHPYILHNIHWQQLANELNAFLAAHPDPEPTDEAERLKGGE